MADQLLEELEHNVESLTLLPSNGGVFEVIVDGDLVYSKKETGRHAEYDEVAERIRKTIA